MTELSLLFQAESDIQAAFSRYERYQAGRGEVLLRQLDAAFALLEVNPESIREQARLKAGDKLDVGYVNGLVVLRKRVPMTPAQARALILSGRDLPALTLEDEVAVQETVAAVRKHRRVS